MSKYYITILDYEAGGVITHELDDEEFEELQECNESFLKERNLNPVDCEWMIHRGKFKTEL